MSEELTLIVVVGEIDEAIAIDGIVTIQVYIKHKMISNCMYARTSTGEYDDRSWCYTGW